MANREACRAYIDQVLVPTLRPRKVVVMDNLPAHKGSHTCATIEATGANLLYLPPHNPDLRGSASKPIENAFAKLKAFLRKAAERTIKDLWNAIRDALPQCTP